MSGGGVTGLPQHGSTAPEMPPLARRHAVGPTAGDEAQMERPDRGPYE